METPALGMKALRRASRQFVHPTGESAALPTTILQISSFQFQVARCPTPLPVSMLDSKIRDLSIIFGKLKLPPRL